MTLWSATPNPVSRTAHSAYSRALAAPAWAAACTTRSVACLSYRPNARAAHSARWSMARARGTPAGSVSISKLIASASAAIPPVTPEACATPAPPGAPGPVTAALRPGCACRGCHNHDILLSSLSQPRQSIPSWLGPAGAGVAGGQADGVLGAVEQFLAQRGRDQHAGLVLEHPGIQGGEDRPDPGL